MKMNSTPTEKFRSRNSLGIYEGIFRRKGVDEEDVKLPMRQTTRLDQNFEGREPVELRTPGPETPAWRQSRCLSCQNPSQFKLRCRAGFRLPQKERYASECEHSQGAR